jgi:hypothetical protein
MPPMYRGPAYRYQTSRYPNNERTIVHFKVLWEHVGLASDELRTHFRGFSLDI